MAARYDFGGIFAQGGQSRLFRATDRVTGSVCIIRTGDTVRQEAIHALEWNHPYILKPFDCGTHPEFGAYAAVEEVKAPSLMDWIRGNPPQEEIQRVALQIAEVLAFLHHRGFLYNDFKPDHFLVLDSEIRVLDLGLCTSVNDRSSPTFSGTFPYISPERLAGRSFDERSDIFAFGMLLLHLFFPFSDWNASPDIGTLQELQKNCGQLEGFWKRLLSEMTALEPNQRVETAHELWERLLPSTSKGTFLFFPMPASSPVDFDAFSEKPILLAVSSSQSALQQIQDQATLHGWRNGIAVFRMDFQRGNINDYFINLSRSLLDQPASDFLTSLEKLQNIDPSKKCLLIFQGADSLSPVDRSSFTYALSCLARSTSYSVLIPGTKAFQLPEELHRRVELPLLNRQSLERLIPKMLPSHGHSAETLAKAPSSELFTAEQIIEELRKDLPLQGFAYWPAAARTLYPARPLDSINVQEMRVLACLAVAGGALRQDILSSSLPLKEEKHGPLLERLHAGGFIHREQDTYCLSVLPQMILSRLRKDRIRDIASNVLAVWPAGFDFAVRYRVARLAGKRRDAAVYALRVARQSEQKQHTGAAMEWYCTAEECGAAVNKTRMFGLLKYALRRAQVLRAKRLMQGIRKRFGKSYRLADLCLEFDHRTNHLASAEKRAAQIVRFAARRRHSRAHDYFTARLAFFHFQRMNLEEAVRLSEELLARNTSEKIKGMAHNNLGVVHFYKGELKEAAEELGKAVRMRHPTLANSYMSLAVTWSRIGNLKKAKRCLARAIGFFSNHQDTDRLSIALLNAGFLCKQGGQMKEARSHYYQSLSLSRLNRNQQLVCANLTNLAVTFELEGRTDRAIQYYARAARTAHAAGIKRIYAIARANAGLQYAFQNRFSRAVSFLMEAVSIYKELNLKVELAEAYEYLGITYLFSNHFHKAEMYLKISERLSVDSGAKANLDRARLLLALTWIRKGLFQKAKESLDRFTDIRPDTFEKGLHQYCTSLRILTSPDTPLEGCREALHEAERIFRKLPAAFWLAKTFQLKAEYSLRRDHYEKARLASSSAFNIFSRLGARKELLNLTKEKTVVSYPEELIDRMADRLPYKILLMIKEVLAEPDPERMISKTLSVALEFTDMERAMLIVMEEPPRIFKSTTLDDSAVQEMYEISKSALDAAARSQQPYMALDAGTDPYLKSKPSIVAAQIMSIVCLPLRERNRLIGALYLDSREGVETLGKTESVLLEIFASLIALVLNKTLILEKSLEENIQLRSSLGITTFPEIVGTSEAMAKVLRSVHQLLKTDLPVLITGETGTGKELIARVLHYCGPRKEESFLAVNCSALTKTLLESELFGHEKGAFTGAVNTKKGLFEQAGTGTLFLDEIGDMPHSMQAKLLRVLQEGEFRRVGGQTTLRSEARVILATNKNLQQLVKKDHFREDLFYRIKGIQIHLPPLRERVGDIPLLAAHFLKTSLLANKKRILGFTPEALEALKRFHWPGNARQLKNEVERAVAFTEKDWIQPEDLDPEVTSVKETPPPPKAATLKEREKQIILEALKENRWNIQQTARALDLTRNGLYGKMRTHGIRKNGS